MSLTHRNAGALAVLVFAVMGCNQLAANPTAGAGSVTGSVPASPSPAPSIAVTAEAAAAPQPPVEFTGRIACGPPVSPDRKGHSETVEVGDDGMVLTRQRGGAWQNSATMSDPRLEGTVYDTWEADNYAMPGAESGPNVAALTQRIVNEAGAWEFRGYGGSFSDGKPIGGDSAAVFVGEGAYEGLIAIMESTELEGACGDEVRGVIFEGAPVPQPYIPE